MTFHIEKAKQKLQARNITQAVVKAIQFNLLFDS